MNTKQQTTIEWHPFPDLKPLDDGQYLTGGRTIQILWWHDGAWKINLSGKSEFNLGIKWWANLPEIPKEEKGPE